MAFSKNRLRKKSQFEEVFKKGKSRGGDLFLVKIKENNLPYSRFAFVVPSRVFKKAVERNKTKRRLREVIRKMKEEIKEGKDVIIIVKSSRVEEMKSKEIEEEGKKIFSKLGILK